MSVIAIAIGLMLKQTGKNVTSVVDDIKVYIAIGRQSKRTTTELDLSLIHI